jgi:general secretion pathway protein K
VAAVTVLAILSALAAGLAHTTLLDQRLVHGALAAMQADALARSGVAVAAALLHETGAAGAPDTLAAPWARDTGPQPLGAGWIDIQVEDEARRLDLHAFADVLPRLLRRLGLDARIADAIADWTDPDDEPRPAGAERTWYVGLAPPYVPRNAPVRSIGELALVRGLDRVAVERLRPYVGVAGERAVNPNTATREVLSALTTAATAERILVVRERRPLGAPEFRTLLPGVPPHRLTARGRHYTVRAVAGVADARRGVEATLSAPPGLEPRIVAWRPFVPED